LAEVRKRLADPHASLDGVCGLLNRAASAVPAKRVKVKMAGRHVRWNRGDDYECMVQGREFANATELDAAWASRTIALTDMYLMRHREAEALGKRSQLNPQWEALYYLREERHFVRVQKCHLRYVYDREGRTNKNLAWTMLNERSPYWVDRHAFSVLKIK